MIKLSYDVEKYRQDIMDLVEPDDTVIELGCHTGGTTRLIPESCRIIALDNSPEAEGLPIAMIVLLSGETPYWE